MNILTKSRELTPKEVYLLTMSPETQKMSDAEGSIIEIDASITYSDINSKGEEQTLLTIKTPEGETFSTNSPTFIEDFRKMNELFQGMGEKVNAIKVSSGMSKNDRKFITCVYEN